MELFHLDDFFRSNLILKNCENYAYFSLNLSYIHFLRKKIFKLAPYGKFLGKIEVNV